MGVRATLSAFLPLTDSFLYLEVSGAGWTCTEK